MTKQTGIALIPLIFGLLLIAAIPLTINQVQKNQNPQNRAADYLYPPTSAPLPINQINCQEIKNLYQTYCQIQLSNPPQVPCSTIQNLINQYCPN